MPVARGPARRGCSIAGDVVVRKLLLSIPLRALQFAAALLILAMALGLVALFASGPVDLVVATVDLFRADSMAEGKVESVGVRDAGGGFRPVVAYTFSVDGKRYSSERVMPGFAGNIGGWSTGDEFVRRYRKGQAVPVYYRSGDPGGSCFLAYGWFKWSFAIACFSVPWTVLVILALCVGESRFRPGFRSRVVVWWLALLLFSAVALSDGVLYCAKLFQYALFAIVLLGVAVAIAWSRARWCSRSTENSMG